MELDKYNTTTAPDAPTSAPTSTPIPTHADTPAASTPTPDAAPQHKKRFTLRIRKRTHPHAAEETSHVNVSVAGPSLQVVDAAEAPGGSAGTGTDAGVGAAVGAAAEAAAKEAREKEEGGVRVLIRIEALDANGESPNTQPTD